MYEVYTPSLKSVYYSLGRSLRLQTADLRAICEAYPSESDAEKALEDVLLLWLHQKYNVKRFGPPTWRMLVEAVDKTAGDKSHVLAKEIASHHPAGRLLRFNGYCTHYIMSLLHVAAAAATAQAPAQAPAPQEKDTGE